MAINQAMLDNSKVATVYKENNSYSPSFTMYFGPTPAEKCSEDWSECKQLFTLPSEVNIPNDMDANMNCDIIAPLKHIVGVSHSRHDIFLPFKLQLSAFIDLILLLRHLSILQIWTDDNAIEKSTNDIVDIDNEEPQFMNNK